MSVGFWSTQNTKSMTNNNFGFYDWNGQFHNVNFPTRNMAKPPVNQLLGVNDSDIAVGFFTGKGNATRTSTASGAAGSAGSTSPAR